MEKKEEFLQTFHNVSENWNKLTKKERETFAPEVHQIDWLKMKDAVAHSFTSMNSTTTFVNDYQQNEFSRLKIEYRDPLFITMKVLTALDSFKSFADFKDSNVVDGNNIEEALKNVQWLWEGMGEDEVERICRERADGRLQERIRDGIV